MEFHLINFSTYSGVISYMRGYVPKEQYKVKIILESSFYGHKSWDIPVCLFGWVF